jgi:hypothetical protein
MQVIERVADRRAVFGRRGWIWYTHLTKRHGHSIIILLLGPLPHLEERIDGLQRNSWSESKKHTINSTRENEKTGHPQEIDEIKA